MSSELACDFQDSQGSYTEKSCFDKPPKKKKIQISFRTSFLKTMAGASKKDMFRRSNTHIIGFLNSDKASSPRFLHIDTIMD